MSSVPGFVTGRCYPILRIEWQIFFIKASYCEFSDILCRVREGNHATDIEKIKAFEDTDTSTWPRKVLIYIAPIT